MMIADAQGQPVTTTSREVAQQLDRAVVAYLGARADTRDELSQVIAADPQCALAHCLDGYLHMLSSRRDAIDYACDALAHAKAASHLRHITRREALHVGALEAWSEGDLRLAARHWDSLLTEHPHDLIALKVSQFVISYLGESQHMRDTVERVMRSWTDETPGYGFVLGCYAYALEETGDYVRADEIGRRAVALNPADIWAAHAVAHVREMQGQLSDGIQWITALADEWKHCSSFANHLRWHEALYHLDLERTDRVLELYDREVRATPTDEYLDVTNATSLLWRLEQGDIDVGPRWGELATRARSHVDDHVLVFVDMHYVMALAAVRDRGAIDHFIESCERFTTTVGSTEATVMSDVGLPLARAVLAHRAGSYSDVVDLVLPIRDRIRSIGGSHAQRDVFEQMLIDAACRAGRLDVASELLADRTVRRPHNRWAWKHRAAVLDGLGATGAADARRELERLKAG